MKSLALNKAKHWLLMALGATILTVLAYRSVGCGLPPDLEKKVNPPDKIDKVAEPIKRTTPTGKTTSPIQLDWKDTGLTGERFTAVTWNKQLWVWVQQANELVAYNISRSTAAGPLGLRLIRQADTNGRMIALAAHDKRLLRILEKGNSRALQTALHREDGTLQWYTLKTIEKSDDQPSGVTFLGHTSLFYGASTIYSLDPTKPEAPKAFTLPFKMYDGAEYMQCNDAFCISLHKARLPILFKGNWKWDSVPGHVNWQVTQPQHNPFAKETEAQKQAADKVYESKLAAMATTIPDRLALNGPKTAFYLREKHLFWSCDMNREKLLHKEIGALQGITWAQHDLLLYTSTTLQAHYKDKVVTLPIPTAKTGTLKLYRVMYHDGALLLEASEEPHTKRKLFATEYLSKKGFPICQ